jgi:hypothetical protein
MQHWWEHSIDEVCTSIDRIVASARVAVEGGPAAAFVQASGFNVIADLLDVHSRLSRFTLYGVVMLADCVLNRKEHPWRHKTNNQFVRLADSLLRACTAPDWAGNARLQDTLAATGRTVVGLFVKLTHVCHEVCELRAVCEWAATVHVPPGHLDWPSPTQAWCELLWNLMDGRDLLFMRRNAWVLERKGTFARVFKAMRGGEYCPAAPDTLRRAVERFDAADSGVRNDLYARWEETGFAASLHVFLQSRCEDVRARENDQGEALWNLLRTLEKSKSINARVAAVKAAEEQAEKQAEAAARVRRSVEEAAVAAAMAADMAERAKAKGACAKAKGACAKAQGACAKVQGSAGQGEKHCAE